MMQVFIEKRGFQFHFWSFSSSRQVQVLQNILFKYAKYSKNHIIAFLSRFKQYLGKKQINRALKVLLIQNSNLYFC